MDPNQDTAGTQATPPPTAATGPAVATTHTDRVVERRSWVPGTFGPGMLVGAMGAIGAVVSLFLPWHDPGVHPSSIPVEFLWDRNPGSSDPSLLILLIPIAVVLVIGAVVPMGAGARLFGGIALLAVAGVFAYQLDRTLGGFRSGLGDVLGSGFYVGAIAGILACVSAMLPSGWGARREIVRTEAVDGDA
jgi:hypothetical protein